MQRNSMMTRAVAIWIAAVALGSSGCEPTEPPPSSSKPEELSYTGSVECGRCHTETFTAWSGSHHDLAMQLANEETVLGDFEDRVFEFAGERFRFFRNQHGFYVNAPAANGELTDFEIAYAFGVDPLQQYLIGFPGGRLQALSVAWDTRAATDGGQRWFHVSADDPARPGDPFHWTGLYQTSNHMCVECHTTHM
jgi:hypothetical protein